MVARIEIEHLEADGVIGCCLELIRDSLPSCSMATGSTLVRANTGVLHDVLPGFHRLAIHDTMRSPS